jgi:Toprim-like
MPKLTPITSPRPPRDVTFLEHVCTRLLGPPSYVSGDGSAQWDCPICGRVKFHTLPPCPEYKDRWRCWVCGAGGDEADLMRVFHPDERYPEHLHRLDMLRLEWQPVLTGASPAKGGNGRTAGAYISSPGESGSWSRMIEESAVRLWQPHAQLVCVGGSWRWQDRPEHPALAWLRQRGLEDATIRAARLGVNESGDVMIPWIGLQGILAVNVRRFNGTPRYMMLRGSRKNAAYPEYHVDDRPVMLAEGELDTLLCRQELGDVVQAITFGGVADRVPEELLPQLVQRVVIVAYDADQAGDSNYQRLREVLPQARCLRPSTGKDVTELHAAVGLPQWFRAQ